MDQVKFFKSCLPQVLLGLFLNILTHIKNSMVTIVFHVVKLDPILNLTLKQIAWLGICQTFIMKLFSEND